MARTSKAMLDESARFLSKQTGIDFTVEWAYGAPRLMADRGSRDVSPRLPSGELLDWMNAFAAGIDLGIHLEGDKKRRGR